MAILKMVNFLFQIIFHFLGLGGQTTFVHLHKHRFKIIGPKLHDWLQVVEAVWVLLPFLQRGTTLQGINYSYRSEFCRSECNQSSGENNSQTNVNLQTILKKMLV